FRLINHQWKEKTRSSFWQKSLIINVLLMLLGLYIMLNLIVLSLFADKILTELYKNKNVIESFTSLLVYYFLFDLVLRFFFQQLPTLSIQPYLTLPIKKSKLLHYILIKSVTSFFNYCAILLFLPFFIKNVASTQTALFSLIWLSTVILLVAGNNFINFSAKKYFLKQPVIMLSYIIGIGLLLYFENTNIVSLSGYFSAVVFYIANNPVFVFIPAALAVLSYYIAYKLLKNNAYIEDTESTGIRKKRGFAFLNNYGEIGQLIGIELKMIFRNSRPKSLMIVSFFFLFYGFMFYRGEYLDSFAYLSATGFFLTSMFAAQYSNFLFSWESSFFECLMANKISLYNYIKSKYYTFVILSCFTYLITLPYAFIDFKIAIINTSFLLYSVGFLSVKLIYFGTFNTSFIDLGKGSFMNYQGTNAIQFLSILPSVAVFTLLYFALKAFDTLNYYFYTIAAIGLLGIVFHKYLIQLIIKQFAKQKHKMIVGFRKK
ncbi:MAG TPA: hypothetical protein DCQ31_17830, partial [Bacteroidales bacterium]|nr:hypothetical protein [Bacteroidales bacterium]